MKQYRFKIFIVVLFVIVAIYYLLPTYYDYTNNQKLQKSLEQIKKQIKEQNPEISKENLESILEVKEDSIMSENPSFRKDREDRIKLGLDLQGGMYLQLEVNTAKLLENLAKDPDTQFEEILAISEERAKKTDEDLVSIIVEELQNRSIRLSRYFGDIRQDESEIIDELKQQEEDAVSRALQVINNRVNQYGVSEPNIQKQGARRIVVELPGVAKEEEAKRLLQGRALLEFRLVKPAEFTVPLLNKIDEVLAGTKITDSLTATDEVTSTDTVSESDTSLVDGQSSEQLDPEEFARQHPFFSLAIVNPQSPYADAYVKDTDRDKLLRLLDSPEVKNIFPDDVEFLFGFEAITDEEGNTYHIMYLVNKTPELTGGVIEDAQATIDQQTNENIVTMQMDSEGATEWARITGSNINQRCAIVLDGAVYSAPNIINKITGGNSQITGMGSAEESKLLEIVLKAGALPAPIDILEERTVGPSLGQDSINSGLLSTLIGFALVAIFMIAYYKKTGVVADLALMFTVLFVFGILAAFKATLTLPGIAGIILTIGMAVDANVIIFERIREELTTGKTVKAAVDSGFKNSYSAIFDSNITTFFTGIILYQFGSGPIQGFALTLMIGIVCSMISALIISHLIINLMTSKGQKLEVGWRVRFFDNLNFDYLSKRKLAYTISTVFAVVGILSFVVRGLEMGIDFKGGTEVAVKFEKPINISDIRSDLSKIGLGKIEIKTFGGETGVLVRTDLQEIPKDVFPKVQAEIEETINKYYPNIEKKVVETTTNSITYEFPNADTTSALVDQLFKEGFQTSKVTEEVENKGMVVRVSIADWIKIHFRETMKDNEFVVQKEDLVGPKVGEELKLDAIIAITLSMLVILIYLGFRFKFVFATGAIIALIHDVIITLGLFSILYGLIDFLNLEINISVIAAFLTLVGYSVNDTVIVFDRIREYMKIHKTAPIEENINKAINRTMSRTIITSFTTLLVVIVLFIGGGDVLRGFSFTLLFGIIIGTYSSIFIASAYVYSYTTKKAKKIQF